MRIRRVRGPHPWRESLQEAFGTPVCRILGHGTATLREVHYEVRHTVLIGSVDVTVPSARRRVDRAVVCGRCGMRVGD